MDFLKYVYYTSFIRFKNDLPAARRPLAAAVVSFCLLLVLITFYLYTSFWIEESLIERFLESKTEKNIAALFWVILWVIIIEKSGFGESALSPQLAQRYKKYNVRHLYALYSIIAFLWIMAVIIHKSVSI